MGDERILTVTAEPLSAEAWAPFGQVIGGPGDGSAECLLELRDNAVFNLDVLSYTWRPLRCDHLNRHHTATQALIPLGGSPAVVVVAPGQIDFSNPGHVDAIRAFTISGSQGINLAIATWHWGPYPIGPEVHLANFQARDVNRDNDVAHLARDLGVVVEVRV
jgi:ureidoglycolate lyase